MNKAEAKKRIRLEVLRKIEDELEFVITNATPDKLLKDDRAEEVLRNAIAEEIQHLAKRAYGFVDESYGRNKATVHRVYETRIDCHAEPGEARQFKGAA